MSVGSWGRGTVNRAFAWHSFIHSFPVPHKEGVLVQACDPSTLEVESGGSGVQDHPWPCSKLEASLSYVSYFLDS